MIASVCSVRKKCPPVNTRRSNPAVVCFAQPLTSSERRLGIVVARQHGDRAAYRVGRRAAVCLDDPVVGPQRWQCGAHQLVVAEQRERPCRSAAAPRRVCRRRRARCTASSRRVDGARRPEANSRTGYVPGRLKAAGYLEPHDRAQAVTEDGQREAPGWPTQHLVDAGGEHLHVAQRPLAAAVLTSRILDGNDIDPGLKRRRHRPEERSRPARVRKADQARGGIPSGMVATAPQVVVNRKL